MNTDILIQGIQSWDRRLIAKSLTLIESQRQQDIETSEQLFQKLLPLQKRAKRIGVTGIPGVGKSTFIEALCLKLLDKNTEARIGVLTIDPRSPLQGGSILADKTRMARINCHPQVYIRPSGASTSETSLGRRMFETMLLLDAAGCTHIIVESVGVGQSDATLSRLVDTCLLLLMPATGDELQAMKKGLQELCDIAIIHKSDGPLLASAKAARAQLQDFCPHVFNCSSTETIGFAEIIQCLEELSSKPTVPQTRYWLEQEILNELRSHLSGLPNFEESLKQCQDSQNTPYLAAREICEATLGSLKHVPS